MEKVRVRIVIDDPRKTSSGGGRHQKPFSSCRRHEGLCGRFVDARREGRVRLPCIPNGENVGIFSLLFSRSHLTTKKSAHISAHPRVYHECGRTIEEVRVRGRLRVREVRVHGFATVRDSSSSSSSSSSLSRAFFLARIFWTPLDGGKKKKKKKKRSTINFRGWVGNREEEEVKENENVPLDRRARARVRKRRSKVCSVGKNGKRKSASIEALFFWWSGVFSRVFFSPSSSLRRKIQKKNTTRSALKTTSANRTQTSLSLSLLSPSLLIQSCAESYCRSIRPVKTWTF